MYHSLIKQCQSSWCNCKAGSSRNCRHCTTSNYTQNKPTVTSCMNDSRIDNGMHWPIYIKWFTFWLHGEAKTKMAHRTKDLHTYMQNQVPPKDECCFLGQVSMLSLCQEQPRDGWQVRANEQQHKKKLTSKQLTFQGICSYFFLYH